MKWCGNPNMDALSPAAQWFLNGRRSSRLGAVSRDNSMAKQ